MTIPTELSREECIELITDEMVGRVAMSTPVGPRIVPVNYAVHGDSVVFRTAPYGELGTYGPGTELAFEVDRLDYERHQGWSVVILGRGQVVQEADEVADIRSTWESRPWAGGSRNMYIRLRWREVTGRRVGEDWSPVTMTPHRRVLRASS